MAKSREMRGSSHATPHNASLRIIDVMHEIHEPAPLRRVIRANASIAAVEFTWTSRTSTPRRRWGKTSIARTELSRYRYPSTRWGWVRTWSGPITLPRTAREGGGAAGCRQNSPDRNASALFGRRPRHQRARSFSASKKNRLKWPHHGVHFSRHPRILRCPQPPGDGRCLGRKNRRLLPGQVKGAFKIGRASGNSGKYSDV